MSYEVALSKLVTHLRTAQITQLTDLLASYKNRGFDMVKLLVHISVVDAGGASCSFMQALFMYAAEKNNAKHFLTIYQTLQKLLELEVQKELYQAFCQDSNNLILLFSANINMVTMPQILACLTDSLHSMYPCQTKNGLQWYSPIDLFVVFRCDSPQKLKTNCDLFPLLLNACKTPRAIAQHTRHRLMDLLGTKEFDLQKKQGMLAQPALMELIYPPVDPTLASQPVVHGYPSAGMKRKASEAEGPGDPFADVFENPSATYQGRPLI